MLLTETEYLRTMSEDFRNVTETAENFNPEEFDTYVNLNLVEELGKMRIDLIYESAKVGFRHVVFNTEKKNVHFVVVIDLSRREILGHYVLDLNEKYGLESASGA